MESCVCPNCFRPLSWDETPGELCVPCQVRKAVQEIVDERERIKKKTDVDRSKNVRNKLGSDLQKKKSRT